jgi:hypothetical protein
MLSLSLAVLLSATPPAPVEAWARKACPLPKEAESNIEYKYQLSERAGCLKRAMNKSLDKVIVPLKKKDPSTFKQWMALQADYNRWIADACSAVEESLWVDPSDGERSHGTGYGGTEMMCHQEQYAWRGFYADAWARNDWKAISAALEAYGKLAPKRQEEVRKYQKQVQKVAAKAPAKVEESDTPARTFTQEEWKHYIARLERAATAPQALAERQCALMPKADAGCAESFRASLVSHLDFSEALADEGIEP